MFISVGGDHRYGGGRKLTPEEATTTNVLAKEIASQLNNKLNTSYQDGGTSKDAEFVRRALALPDSEDGKYLVLAYYTEKLFYEYKNKFIEFLEQKSRETGRKLIAETHEFDDFTEYWWYLDRGDLDSENCIWDLKKRQACDYPAGFVEYRITMRIFNDPRQNNFEWNQELFVQFDDMVQNKTNNILFHLSTQEWRNENEIMYDIGVKISGTEQKYDEFYKWRNQQAADIRNGMYVKLPRSEWRKWKGVPFNESWMVDTSKEWESQKNPDSVEFGEYFSATYSYTPN